MILYIWKILWFLSGFLFDKLTPQLIKFNSLKKFHLLHWEVLVFLFNAYSKFHYKSFHFEWVYFIFKGNRLHCQIGESYGRGCFYCQMGYVLWKGLFLLPKGRVLWKRLFLLPNRWVLWKGAVSTAKGSSLMEEAVSTAK